MARPPLVSRAQLQSMNPDWDGIMKARAREPKPALRKPLGLIPNSLPQFYLAMRDGSLLVMQDKSKNPDGATGPQVCLATISPETLQILLAGKSPMELKP